RDGYIVECGPNGFLDNKPFALELAHELDLERQVIAASESAGRNRFLYSSGRLHTVPTGPLALLRSGLLTWHGKLRLLAEFCQRAQSSDDDESVEHFFCRRFGPEAAEKLGDAFVTGIYAGDARRLSLKACFPRLAAMEQGSGSLIRGFLRAARQR